jgi:hypothetical protein
MGSMTHDSVAGPTSYAGAVSRFQTNPFGNWSGEQGNTGLL